MKLKTILIVVLFVSNIFAQTQSAKVIGYLPSYQFSKYNQIEFCKLTHLNLCFANPDSSGNIIFPSISTVRNKALTDNPNIKIFISLAGGAVSSQQATDWSNLIDIAANRPAFIQKIVNFVLTNNLDGVDVDLEWSNVTSGYSPFLVELKQALTAQNKTLSAALPNNTLYSNLTSAGLAALDFINIMAYDATGPWAPNQPGQHSSSTFAQNGINFWKNTVGVPSNKLTLGVPFYGFDFVDSSTVNAKTFSQIVAMNTAYAQLDNVGNLYYNGIPTIQNKVSMAKNQVAGIMMWELGQDSYDQYSLLSTIHSRYTSLGVTTTGLCGNEVTLHSDEFTSLDFQAYPNPSTNFINVVSNLTCTLELYNSIGQKMLESFVNEGVSENKINISNLTNGIYIAKFIDQSGKSIKSMKIIKQ